MISADVSKVLEELKAYHADTVRRLENMVRGFSYIISKEAIEKTPIGDAEVYLSLYKKRQREIGLDVIEGVAKGGWQVNTSGNFEPQFIYTVFSGKIAYSLIKTSLKDYKLGDTVFVGNKGFYIKLLENNYSSQTNNLGIMQPTLDSIMQTYKVDLPRLYKEG